MDYESEIQMLKQRVDRAETAINGLNGSFEFVSMQLRDMQKFMRVKFDQIDTQFDRLDTRFDRLDKRFDRLEGRSDQTDGRLGRLEGRLDTLESKVDALPRVIADLISKR